MRHRVLTDDIAILLGDLCREWGFCNRLNVDALLSDGQNLSAEAFAEALLKAEGMNPSLEVEWRRRIRDRFTERYGSSTSLATYRHED